MDEFCTQLPQPDPWEKRDPEIPTATASAAAFEDGDVFDWLRAVVAVDVADVEDRDAAADAIDTRRVNPDAMQTRGPWADEMVLARMMRLEDQHRYDERSRQHRWWKPTMAWRGIDG